MKASLSSGVAGILRRGPSEVQITKRSTTSAAYAAAHRGTRWTVVEPASRIVRTEPVHHGSLPSRLDEHLVTEFPDLGVVTIPGGIVAGEAGWVLGPDGALLHDHSWHGDAPEQRRMYARRTGDRFTVQRLKGTVVTLATFAAWDNYGHFLLDAVPRLRLLEDAGVDLRAADHVLVHAPHPNGWRILERLGVPMDRARPMPADVAYQADTLISATFPGLRRNYPPWVPRWLGARLAPVDRPRTRLLYVPRLVDRQILDLDLIAPILDEHGFESFEPTDHADPLDGFASARVVVGAHGSGLSDIVVCRPGTPVLELLPSTHQMPYYYTLADGRGLPYGHLVGPGRPDLAPPGHPTKAPFTLDPDELRAALEATLALAPAPDVEPPAGSLTVEPGGRPGGAATASGAA